MANLSHFWRSCIGKATHNKRSDILYKFLNNKSDQIWGQKIKWPIIWNGVSSSLFLRDDRPNKKDNKNIKPIDGVLACVRLRVTRFAFAADDVVVRTTRRRLDPAASVEEEASPQFLAHCWLIDAYTHTQENEKIFLDFVVNSRTNTNSSARTLAWPGYLARNIHADPHATAHT